MRSETDGPQPILFFVARGCEPFEFQFADGWAIESIGGKTFTVSEVEDAAGEGVRSASEAEVGWAAGWMPSYGRRRKWT